MPFRRRNNRRKGIVIASALFAHPCLPIWPYELSLPRIGQVHNL
jgi:hypothetical protein